MKLFLPTVLFVLFSAAVQAQTSIDLSGPGGGSIILGYDSQSCGGAGAPGGAMRYNSSSSCLEFCDGTEWTCPSSSGGCTVVWDALEDVEGVGEGVLTESAIELITLDGCASADVSISGDGTPEFQICSNIDCSGVSHTWSSSSESIESGEFIQSRLNSSSTAGGTHTARVTIAATATDWVVETSNNPFFVASTQLTVDNSFTIVMNKPSGTAENDLLIASIIRERDNDPMTPPAGWVQIHQGNIIGNNARKATWYKVATASEPSSYSFNLGSEEKTAGSIIAIRNVDTSNPIDTHSINNGTSDTNTQLNSVTTSRDNNMLVAIAGLDMPRLLSPPTNYFERVEVEEDVTLSVATRLFPLAGASGSPSFSIDNGATSADYRTTHISVNSMP